MTQLRFDGRVAIVTGAGGGLGREHALLLAARGAQVVVNDVGGPIDGTSEDAGPAAQTAEEIVRRGGQAIADTHSVATPEGGAAIVACAIEAFGRLDILVNNAGIVRDRAFHKLTPDAVGPVLDVHLGGAFNVTQPAWSVMREQGYGRVVNTSSGAGIFGNFGQASYTAAKTGLLGLTRTLAVEGARHNINVNAIAPAARTRMTEDALGPLAEKLDPSLISPLMAWLAHETCSVTGEFFHAAGGRVTQFQFAFTAGYFNPELTLEDLRDHFDEVRDQAHLTVPPSAENHARELMQLLE